MVGEFAGKVALVTGTSGIGLGAALRMARDRAGFCINADYLIDGALTAHIGV